MSINMVRNATNKTQFNRQPNAGYIAKSTLATLLIGALFGAVLATLLSPSSGSAEQKMAADDQPLYWVAPMDPNFRRDEPGKSPMGMDLIPVYPEDANASSEAGRIYIAPNVVNNLGVRTAGVTLKSMQTPITTLGYVQYDQDQMRHIHTRVDGWLEKLYVKAAGDPVKQGEPLYQLYSPQLVNAQEELVVALKRNNTLLIDAAKRRLKALHLSASFIERLVQTKQVQQSVTFYSPKSGVVAGLKVREGFYVNPANTLMSIAQIDQVWVEAEVFENDVAQVQPGLPVVMALDAFAGQKWHGVVDYVYPTLTEKTRTLRARLKFDNPDHKLKPNMFAQVTIMPKAKEAKLVVPREAVIRTGTQDRVVLAFDNGQFKSVAVTLGQVSADEVEIVSGVLVGDTVVTSAQFLIDSESSKTSDFLRMEAISEYQSARVSGVVNGIDATTRLINISRGPIEKWGRAAATMDFVLSPRLDMTQLQVGTSIEFTFEVQEELVIVDLELVELTPVASTEPLPSSEQSGNKKEGKEQGDLKQDDQKRGDNEQGHHPMSHKH